MNDHIEAQFFWKDIFLGLLEKENMVFRAVSEKDDRKKLWKII